MATLRLVRSRTNWRIKHADWAALARRELFIGSPEIKMAKQKSATGMLDQSSFGTMMIVIAEDELSASVQDPEFRKRMYEMYVAAAPGDARAWLRKQLEAEFLCIDKRPNWREEIEWPFVDGRPMVFLHQFTIPNIQLAKEHLGHSEEIYVFAIRKYDGGKYKGKPTFTMEYRAIAQSR